MSKKERSVVKDLLPDLGELAGMAKSMIANRHQGPFHRLGFNIEDLKNYQSLPWFRRSRDYHLYDQQGRRFLDLYRGDGTNILGYSLPHLREQLKNRLDQGTFHGLPHVLQQQVQRELARLFPRHTAVICPDRYRVQSVLELLGVRNDRPMVPLREDLSGEGPEGNYSFWQPFSVSPGRLSIAVLPSLSLQGPFVLLIESEHFRKQLAAHGKDAQAVAEFLEVMVHLVPAWSLVPVLAGLGALESLGAFAGYQAGPDGLGVMGNTPLRDLQGKLGIWREAQWMKLPIGPSWRRMGPYLMHTRGPEEYSTVFARALGEGILLNPRSAGFNLIPGLMSSGESRKLSTILED